VIARIWTARTTDAENADTYQRLFRDDVLAHLRTLPGFRDASLLRRDHDAGTEFMTVALFDSRAAIRAFAGDDDEAASVSARARAVLDDIDERVRHFTVAETGSAAH
jgi:heme-degrading monooxygenase HmoA